jgi:competence protein ComEC
VIRTPDNHAVLIDVGSMTVSDLRRRLLTPYLRSVGCSTVDEVILSHGDYGRISGAAEVFADYGRPAFFTNPQFAREVMGDLPAEDFLETVLDADRAPGILHEGDRLNLSGGATLDVLWPPMDCAMSSNNCALVLKLTYAGRSVIFASEIQEAAERELWENPGPLECDVLVAPGRGSAEAGTAEFLRATGARVILVSCEAKLSRKEKVFDLVAKPREVYRTGRCGAVTVTIDSRGGVGVDSFLGGNGGNAE